ncbi:secreted RxLR effector protein 161-like [Beta vulgaris subsp. vulgaris]|uniref:secreted RxLR effector protein 161-like n=1 Tax=Beta vulgaris subsp. vulgaris TaxID=3555 RepID=UPI0020374CDC|nr:secreted RxLR effector protein 161-like [Beta vulgaris subsp. vulgaris]
MVAYALQVAEEVDVYDLSTYREVVTYDMLRAAKNKSDVQKLKELLSVEFEMKDWILLGVGMSTTKPIYIPSATNSHLSVAFAPKYAEEKEYMSRVPYASVIGSLLYAMVFTRADFTHAVNVVSRFVGDPGEEHWQAVKRIFWYLRGMSKIGLIYEGDVTCFSDFDYAMDVDGRRSMTSYVFTLGGSVVNWKATLQPTLTLSTIEHDIWP